VQGIIQGAFDPANFHSNALATLPVLFCELKGGRREQTVPVVSAWTLLRYAARLLDDVQDGHRAGAGTEIGPALNVSTGLIFTACGALSRLVNYGVDAATAGDISQTFYKVLLQVCSGQHLDLTLRAPTLEVNWQVVEAKTGSFVGLICWAGARLATGDRQFLSLCRQFGSNLGVLDQIRDDLADLWDSERQTSDLKQSHMRGLPAIYALSVLPPDRRRQLQTFLETACSSVTDAEEKARQLIIESGAGVYLAVQSNLYYKRSVELVAQMDMPATAQDKLREVLNSARISVR
jgi:competence protein ComQ